jgi:hypothetical protein
MSENDVPTGGKHYTVGNVGVGARVIVGDHNTWIEGQLASLPDGEELAKAFEALVKQIQDDETLDEDTRTLAVEKTNAVVEGLAGATESPGKLRLALTDAKSFLTGAAGWAWDGLQAIVSSEAAQKTISTIADVGAKAAIAALVGLV